MLVVGLLAIAAAAVSASPLAVERQAQTIVLPLTHVSKFTSIKNIVNKGQQRLGAINANAVGPTPDVSSGSVTNEDVTYVAPVTIGGSTWQLIVDTGCKSLRQYFQESPKTVY